MSRSISLFGDWFSMIAVIALLREVSGSNPQALSGVLILKLLPIFLAGPLAGVFADRYSRKAIMVVADLRPSGVRYDEAAGMAIEGELVFDEAAGMAVYPAR